MTTQERHPDEGHLIRYLDGELDSPAEGSLKEHLADCPYCRDELQLMRQVASAFSDELGLDTIETPVARLGELRRKRINVPWRVAAAIVIMLPLSASLRPVRAFVASSWQSVVQVLGFSRPAVVADSLVTEAPATTAGAVITFVPRLTVFTVNVDSWQQSGSLRIEFGSTENASAQVLTAGGLEDIVVVPNGGIRIGNSSTSVASYRLVVPTSLDRLVLSVGGQRVAQLENGQFPPDTTLSLFRP